MLWHQHNGGGLKAVGDNFKTQKCTSDPTQLPHTDSEHSSIPSGPPYMNPTQGIIKLSGGE